MGLLESPDVKQRANRLLREAGRGHLLPLGLRQRSRSSRYWIADRQWWLVNVEFQPSNHSVGSYLNVGLQHLWVPKAYSVFEYSSRQQIDKYGHYIELDGDESSAVAAADALGGSAAASVARWLTGLAHDRHHHEWLTSHMDDLWDAVNAAFAHAALGNYREAGEVFHDTAKRTDSEIPWQIELRQMCDGLAQLTRTPDEFRAEAERRVQTARELLKLPAT